MALTDSRSKHRGYLRAVRRELEKNLGHKMTGRQWVRWRRAHSYKRTVKGDRVLLEQNYSSDKQ